MFLLGVFLYNEPLSSAHMLTFALIWTALCLYSADSAMHYRMDTN
jgi:chloramphenicol-sensitive protein RarD